MTTATDTDYVSKHSVGSEDEFVKREMFIWGEDYIIDLMDKGFTPILVLEGTTYKWTWINRLKNA